MNEKRILFITSAFVPYSFSEALCNAKLVIALISQGWKVDVISRTNEGEVYSLKWMEPWNMIESNTYTIAYKRGNVIKRTLDMLFSSLYMGTITPGTRWMRRAYLLSLKLLRKSEYDVIMTRSPNDIGHYIGAKLQKKTGLKWIANWNDPATTIWPEPYNHSLPAIKKWLLRSKEISLLNSATINTFPSQSLLNHFINSYPEVNFKKSRVIPHIALEKKFRPSSKYKKREEFRLCHAGNLSSERNPEILFAAIAKLKNEGFLVWLDIMGYINESIKDQITRFDLSSNVHFMGGFPYFDALSQMSDYDVLVLLEAQMEHGVFFASKLVDYAQSGRPILAISPNSGFAVDLINNFGGGLAVDNTSVNSVYEGIKRMYEAWNSSSLDTIYSTDRLNNEFSAEHVCALYREII